MAGGYLYLGEAAGARIIRSGVGYSQVGDPYNLEHKTWDVYPAGDEGESLFRTLVALVRHTNGYNVSLQPILDGVPLVVKQFSGGPPAAGTEGVATCRYWVRARGTRFAAIFKTLTVLGETELVDLFTTPVPIRVTR